MKGVDNKQKNTADYRKHFAWSSAFGFGRMRKCSFGHSLMLQCYSYEKREHQCTVHAPLKAAACIFFTPFSQTISLFLRRFFQKILSLCMACIQERLVIKSGL